MGTKLEETEHAPPQQDSASVSKITVYQNLLWLDFYNKLKCIMSTLNGEFPFKLISLLSEIL